MLNAVEQEIDRFLHTGAHDTLSATWPGASAIERARRANAALRDALVIEALSRTRHASMPGGLDATDLVAVTRAKVSPMVVGLFPAHVQPTVLDVLARSVIYLTPRNIEAILRGELHLGTAWSLANLYLLSCDAEPLSPDAPQIIGLSQATTCYVSMQYFRVGDRFDDVVVHEAAHIFHNCKRERIGLKGTRRREWLLEVDFGKRETFAYACEAMSRIHELGDSARARRELLSELEAGPMPSDERVDANEFVDILREAVGVRNGWKRILQRCSPRPRQAAGSMSTAAT
jgi:hypothetical protein